MNLKNSPELGYIFYPAEAPDHPGHPRLDVLIPAEPTFRHFDPKKAQFQVVLPPENVGRINVYHPWTQTTTYHVCPSRVILTDHIGKQIEAFSFGGELQISSVTEKTVCVLTSPAPIIPLFSAHDLPGWLTAEVEVLLARRRANWNPDHPHDFEVHLATVDPFALYVSCLYALSEAFDDLPAEEDDLTSLGRKFVEQEIERLKNDGKWPVLVPALDDLL